MNTGVPPVVSSSLSSDHVFLEPKKMRLGLHQDAHAAHFSAGFYTHSEHMILVIRLGTILVVFGKDVGLTGPGFDRTLYSVFLHVSSLLLLQSSNQSVYLGFQ
jgi:hypothetical protein